MNASHATNVGANKSTPNQEIKPGFRTKTIATRLTPDELTEVEFAAEQAEKPLSEWLRDMALKAARQRHSDPVELLLAEIWAVRYTLLNLFHTGAQATVEGRPLLPESVMRIRDQADARKLDEAHRILADSLIRQAEGEGQEP
jgi:hypothetical protein